MRERGEKEHNADLYIAHHRDTHTHPSADRTQPDTRKPIEDKKVSPYCRSTRSHCLFQIVVAARKDVIFTYRARQENQEKVYHYCQNGTYLVSN